MKVNLGVLLNFKFYIDCFNAQDSMSIINYTNLLIIINDSGRNQPAVSITQGLSLPIGIVP